MSSKQERLSKFLDRLNSYPAFNSHDEAFQCINEAIDEVEDAYSGVSKDPDAAQSGVSDGRMYGPAKEFGSHWKGRADLIRYAHAHHDTFIQENGAILIQLRRKKIVLLSKAGADGEEVVL